jgi:hypothetical protein
MPDVPQWFKLENNTHLTIDIKSSNEDRVTKAPLLGVKTLSQVKVVMRSWKHKELGLKKGVWTWNKMLGVRPLVDPADNKQKGQSWGYLLAYQIHLQNAIVMEFNVVNTLPHSCL